MPKTSMKVRRSDMSDEMQREALQVALLAVNMYKEEDDIANYIKTEFDRKHGLSWHCIIGSSGIRKEFERKHGKYWQCIVGNCGCSVSHDTDSYISFSVDGKRIVLFKTD